VVAVFEVIFVGILESSRILCQVRCIGGARQRDVIASDMCPWLTAPGGSPSDVGGWRRPYLEATIRRQRQQQYQFRYSFSLGNCQELRTLKLSLLGCATLPLSSWDREEKCCL
jgi:hypothetical protein